MDMVQGDSVGHGVLARWYMETPWYMESGTWHAWYMVTLTRRGPDYMEGAIAAFGIGIAL